MASAVPAPPTVTVTTPPRGTPDINVAAQDGSPTMSSMEDKVQPGTPKALDMSHGVDQRNVNIMQQQQPQGLMRGDSLEGHMSKKPEAHVGLGTGQHNLKVGNPPQDRHNTPNFDRHTPNNLAAPRNVDRQVPSPVPMPSPRHIPRPMGPSFISPIPRAAPPPAAVSPAAYSQAAAQAQANLLRSSMFPGTNPALRGVPPFQQMQIPPVSRNAIHTQALYAQSK